MMYKIRVPTGAVYCINLEVGFPLNTYNVATHLYLNFKQLSFIQAEVNWADYIVIYRHTLWFLICLVCKIICVCF